MVKHFNNIHIQKRNITGFILKVLIRKISNIPRSRNPYNNKHLCTYVTQYLLLLASFNSWKMVISLSSEVKAKCPETKVNFFSNEILVRLGIYV